MTERKKVNLGDWVRDLRLEKISKLTAEE